MAVKGPERWSTGIALPNGLAGTMGAVGGLFSMGLDAGKFVFVRPFQGRSGLVALLLNSLVVIIGILGGYFFSVFVQDVNPGAFAAGITLLTGVPEVVISCVKAALFGLIAGLVACYRGLTISGGGAKAVGNAVNETVVYAFMALFVVNVVVTAIGIRMSAK